MFKHKTFFLCLALLIISIVLLFTLSIKTGNMHSKVNDMKKQVNITKATPAADATEVAFFQKNIYSTEMI